MAFKYVDGETIVLDSGETTDTALSPGAVGSFEAFTLAPYEEVDSITYKINWDEKDTHSDDEDADDGDGADDGDDTDDDDNGGGGGCFISSVAK